MVSLKGRWGSEVMRHIVTAGEVLSECGRGILPGLRRFWSTMCFLVVRISHSGSMSDDGVSVGSRVSVLRRFLVVEAASLRCASDLMCLRSALDALRIWEAVNSGNAQRSSQPYLNLV